MGVTTYVLGFAFGPLVWAPLSEARGRRPVYFISWTVFTIFQIPCALAHNSATLIVARLIAGTFGSSPLANAGGTLADIWLPHQRGKAMSLFAAAPFLGPVLGPVIGGFLTQYVSWRWTFWLSLIYAGVMLINLYFLPETYGKALLEAKARRLRKETRNHNLYAKSEKDKPTMVELYRVSLSRPWLMFFEPIVLLFSIYVALLYGILYLLFIAFPIIFEGPPLSFYLCRTTRMGSWDWRPRLYRYWRWKYSRRRLNSHHKSKLSFANEKTCQGSNHLARSTTPANLCRRFPHATQSLPVRMDQLSNPPMDRNHHRRRAIRTRSNPPFPLYHELHRRLLSSIRRLRLGRKLAPEIRPWSNLSPLGFIVLPLQFLM